MLASGARGPEFDSRNPPYGPVKNSFGNKVFVSELRGGAPGHPSPIWGSASSTPALLPPSRSPLSSLPSQLNVFITRLSSFPITNSSSESQLYRFLYTLLVLRLVVLKFRIHVMRSEAA